MTAQEKIAEIEKIVNDDFPFRTLEVSERLQQLRDSVKVSDLFIANHGADISAVWAEKILGFRVVCNMKQMNAKLESAFKNGYIKSYTVRKYSRDFTYYTLTPKAKKIMKI